MKVLHFYQTYKTDSQGGVEQFIWQICKGVQKVGVESQVLSLSKNPSDMIYDGHMVYRSKLHCQLASTRISFSVLSRFRHLAKQADLIHYHYPWPLMDLVHLLSGVQKPTLLTYHSDIIRQKYLLPFYQPLQRYFLSKIDCIVATSPNYFQTSPTLEAFSSKVRVIPIGLDKATYPDASEEKLQFWKSKFIGRFFLFVGVLRYYKGLHILLEASNGTMYPIVIVGAGPIERELKERVKTLGLSNIHFLGSVDDEDKVALMQLCYGIVFPSHLRSEAFGLSLLEGAMFGKPMISSEIGTGTSYINIHNKTGLVVPKSDALALRGAMQTLWNHPDRAYSMGHEAQKRYEALFTAERMAASYVNLYQELLDRPSS